MDQYFLGVEMIYKNLDLYETYTTYRLPETQYKSLYFFIEKQQSPQYYFTTYRDQEYELKKIQNV